MKGTGIIRRVDELGRIVIPKEIRRMFGVSESTPMEIFTEDKKIIIQKYDEDICIKERLKEFNSTFVESKDSLDYETIKTIETHIDALFTIIKSIEEREE